MGHRCGGSIRKRDGVCPKLSRCARDSPCDRHCERGPASHVREYTCVWNKWVRNGRRDGLMARAGACGAVRPGAAGVWCKQLAGGVLGLTDSVSQSQAVTILSCNPRQYKHKRCGFKMAPTGLFQKAATGFQQASRLEPLPV
jgi:hypothetical protein